MTNKAETYQQIIAKCWADDAFKQRLIADPAAVLRAEGMDLPEGMQIQVHENTDQHLCLVIPQPPKALGDDDLDAIAGGAWFDCSHTDQCGVRPTNEPMRQATQ